MQGALTGGNVLYRRRALPAHTSHLIKTCLCCVVQEAHNNSARYAGGADQQVNAIAADDFIDLEISDSGPGIGQAQVESEDRRGLGLSGMSNRISAFVALWR